MPVGKKAAFTHLPATSMPVTNTHTQTHGFSVVVVCFSIHRASYYVEVLGSEWMFACVSTFQEWVCEWKTCTKYNKSYISSIRFWTGQIHESVSKVASLRYVRSSTIYHRMRELRLGLFAMPMEMIIETNTRFRLPNIEARVFTSFPSIRHWLKLKWAQARFNFTPLSLTLSLLCRSTRLNWIIIALQLNIITARNAIEYFCSLAS